MSHVALSDGTPIWVDDRGGDGPPLVLLQGLQFDAEFFWQKNLAGLMVGNRVVAIDHRSHGLSGKPIGGHSLRQAADDLGEILAALDLDRVCLVGVAFGGLVALTFLESAGASRLRSLVLCEMTPRLSSTSDWAHPTFGDFPPEAAAAYGDQVRADRGVLAGFLAAAFGQPVDEATRAAIAARTWLTPTAAVADYIDDMARHDFRAIIPTIDIPLLALYGRRNNPVMPGDVGRWIAEAAPFGELVELTEAGHSPFWDDPQGFNAAVAAFAAAH